MRVSLLTGALALAILLAAPPLRAENPDEKVDTVSALDILEHSLSFHPVVLAARAAGEIVRHAAGYMLARALFPRCGDPSALPDGYDESSERKDAAQPPAGDPTPGPERMGIGRVESAL